ncbi:MAG: hypothetical protein IJW23_13930 [Lentisphaeria bacterium]|nr:hypothetical protein [Lentisphaeria bacterium]
MQTDIISSVPLPAQENWRFAEELKKPEKRSFSISGSNIKNPVFLSGGVKIVKEITDAKGMLCTAFDDLEGFFREMEIPTGNYPIIARIKECGPYDSFEIEISKDECCIYGSNLEGIRRGICHLEDLIMGNGEAVLEPGIIRKKAWVKHRISRCFFGPIRRPPNNRDELLDEYDYYPDAYLNRLAHEGINGLWLTVTFKDLCRTGFAPDYGKDAPKRLAKLRRTVAQCLRYGIKTYIFTIEPVSWDANDPVIKKYPELAGAKLPGGRVCFCPSSKTAQRYLYESVNYIFSEVPDLGGMINISLGERSTTCLSSIHTEIEWSKEEGTEIKCPRCGHLPHNEIIFNSVSAMTAGMRAASPEAEFISWNYIPNALEQRDWVYTLSKMPEGATPMWNFESGGTAEQLGKKRVGGDYWLSYVGPSERFRRFAAQCPPGIKPGAKLQVGCSHELATVPYIPVPGLLYRKYRAMRELGVETVMQCWYFGNYPGIMNKAAGLLSFEDFSSDEQTFLSGLLRPEWGKYADAVAEVYSKCSEAYSNYPLSNTMQYYGPYHDGIVWPLYCNEQNLPLAPTWQTNYPVSGDTIGEALENHTLEEVTELAHRLSSGWSKAVAKLEPLKQIFSHKPERLRDIDLLRVLELHFIAGYDIFKFYSERSKNSGVTPVMKEILERQIKVSREAAELCRKDSRIGFHSEAENYKYFPEKLEARAAMLERELVSPAPACSTLVPIGDGRGEHKAGSFTWSLEYDQSDLLIDLTLNGKSDSDQIMVTLRENCYTPLLLLDLSRRGTFFPNISGSSFKITELSEECWKISFRVPYKLFTSDPASFRIAFGRYLYYRGKNEQDCAPEHSMTGYRLCHGVYQPQFMYQICRKS